KERLHKVDLPGARDALAQAPAPPFQVLVADNDPTKVEAGRQVVLAWQRAGVRAELKPIPFRELARATGEDGSPPAFQAAITGSSPLASYDPDFLVRLFGSEA